MTPANNTPANNTPANNTPASNKADKDTKLSVANIVKVALWLGLVAYLATSIPHVSWVYHKYDELHINIVVTTSLDSWILSYLVAIGIDITIASLAYLLFAGVQRANKLFVWIFLIVLSLMSWYFNFLYVTANNPATPNNAATMWNNQIIGSLTIGSITPVIVSSAPIFVLAYTFIMGVLGDSKEISVSEMEQHVIEMEQKNNIKARMRKAKLNNLVSGISDTLDSANIVKRDVLTTIHSKSSPAPIDDVVTPPAPIDDVVTPPAPIDDVVTPPAPIDDVVAPPAPKISEPITDKLHKITDTSNEDTDMFTSFLNMVNS